MHVRSPTFAHGPTGGSLGRRGARERSQAVTRGILQSAD